MKFTPSIIAVLTLLCHEALGNSLRGKDERNLVGVFTYVGNDAEISSHSLQECQGDCDSDYDCDWGLVCAQRDTEDVFGCYGEADDYTDYCAKPKLNQLVLVGNNNIAPGSLQRCEGDCDSDSDCADGLKCFKRDGYTETPGCVGEGASNSDYCYEPATLAYVGNNNNADHGLGLCEGKKILKK